jgi:hypothetical protein
MPASNLSVSPSAVSPHFPTAKFGDKPKLFVVSFQIDQKTALLKSSGIFPRLTGHKYSLLRRRNHRVGRFTAAFFFWDL